MSVGGLSVCVSIYSHPILLAGDKNHILSIDYLLAYHTQTAFCGQLLEAILKKYAMWQSDVD